MVMTKTIGFSCGTVLTPFGDGMGWFTYAEDGDKSYFHRQAVLIFKFSVLPKTP